ncbi:hypothetical protein [Ectobacillus sp. sgz5001026]|uniref:hypothetical protein n=1 Tax=Ectobacillus sp. sgz5001026 TaxID=3242473 RepID=UPI0036D44013
MKLYESKITCPKCNKRIRNIPNDSYAFKKNSNYKIFEDVCSYCYFQGYLDYYLNNAKLFDTLGLSPHVIKPYFVLNNITNKYRLVTIPNELKGFDTNIQSMYRMYFELNSFRDILTSDDNFETLAYRIFSLKNKGIYLFDELFGIETENNLAVIFYKYHDKDYIHINGGINTDNEMYLQKEILDSFKLITLEDYIYKYQSCKYLENLNDGDFYSKEAYRIKSEALNKFNIEITFFDSEYKNLTKRDVHLNYLIEDENSIDYKDVNEDGDIYKQLKSFIFKDFKETFSGFVHSLRRNDLPFEQKLEVFNKYLSYVDTIRNGKYICEGLHTPLDLDPGITLILKREGLDYNNSINEAYILFEGWKLTDDDHYLEQSFDRINIYFQEHILENLYTLVQDVPTKSYDNGLNIIESIERICNYFTFFNQNFGSEIKNLQLKATFKKFTELRLKETRYSSLLSDDLETNLIIFLAKMIEPGVLFREIITSYIDKLENSKLGTPRELILEIKELRHLFIGVFEEKIIDILYQSKSTFENLIKNEKDEDSLSLYIVHYLDRITERIVYLKNKEQIQNNEILELFDFKRFQFAFIPKGIENYKVVDSVENLLNSLQELLIDKISKRPELNIVIKNLELELGRNICDRLGGNLKTLATAEYLYNLFVLGSSTEKDEFKDYSCISILYYKALESFLNKFLFEPYINKHFSTNKDFSYISSQCIFDYFPVPNKQDLKSHYFYKNRSGNYYLSNKLALGNIGHFLKLEEDKPNPKYLIAFLNDIIKPSKNVVKEFNGLSTNILGVKNNRNNAAHGGNIINKNQAIQDKKNVFFLDNTVNCKKILIRLLNILK